MTRCLTRLTYLFAILMVFAINSPVAPARLNKIILDPPYDHDKFDT
jgi:hypothetical protein